MKNYLIFFFLLFSLFTIAQKPSAKVDINIDGRKENEVNEPGYTPWVVDRNSVSKTVDGVTFTLKVTAPTKTSTFRTSWSKTLIQKPYYARLANDGVKISNDSLLAHPGQGGEMELHITGLPIGVHELQTYHNVWESASKADYSPLSVYLNDKLIHCNIKRSVQVKKNTDATILLTELNVTDVNQEMILRISSDRNFVAANGKKTDLNVNINGFELNTIDASKQAREPIPNHGDMHADADNGYLNLQWKSAINELTKSHQIYFGTDSAGVANATKTNTEFFKGELPMEQTEYRVEDLYNLNIYYWRVDEVDSNGEITKGKVWSFRPRHLAFRGAEGYGRFAIGGRGGKVVEVINLNDDGPGSLREAIRNDIGPRTIVFSVSGIISLKSRLVVSDKFVTIAGQTAPGKGICIRSAPLGIGSDAICRFIRTRLGAGTTYDGLGMAGANNSIVDHCSVSWTIDEAFSSRGGKNLTLQRTLISEALNIAGHSKYKEGSKHGFAATIGGDVGSFHHNLLAHCNGRNWSLGGGLNGDGYYAGSLDIFNNVVYNWGYRATDGGAQKVNFVNNYYKEGIATTLHLTLRAQLEGVGKGSQSYYYSGNILQNPDGTFACDGTDNECGRTYVASNGQKVNWEVFVDEPFFPSYARTETAKDAYKSVLSDVGCNMPMFDDHDQRIIKETLTGTYTYTGSKSKVGGIIDHQDDVGGFEKYLEETRPVDFDTDHDGLPNWWEKLYGSNPNSAAGDFSDSNADSDKDGYTALENYLEWMSVPHFFLKMNKKVTIELSAFTAACEKPKFTCNNTSNFKVKIAGSKLKIKSNSSANGITYLNVKAVDEDGSEITRVIGICIKQP